MDSGRGGGRAGAGGGGHPHGRARALARGSSFFAIAASRGVALTQRTSVARVASIVSVHMRWGVTSAGLRRRESARVGARTLAFGGRGLKREERGARQSEELLVRRSRRIRRQIARKWKNNIRLGPVARRRKERQSRGAFQGFG